MRRAKTTSLQNKALGLGLLVTLAVLALTDIVILGTPSKLLVRQWDQMHEHILQDWRRMCARALAGKSSQLLPRLAEIMLMGPLRIDSAYLEGPHDQFIAHSDPQAGARGAAQWRQSLSPGAFVDRRLAVTLPDGSRGWAGIVYPAPGESEIRGIAEDQRRGLMLPLVLAHVLVLLLVGGVSVVVVRTIVRPLRRLTDAVREVSRGDFTSQVQVSGSGELADLEQDFNAMARRLDEIERLKSNFLGKITHDLRNPLSAVMGHAELLLRGIKGALTPGQKQSIEAIHRNSQALAELITNILDMTKMEAGRMEYAMSETDLGELLGSVAALMQDQAERFGVTLKTETPPDLPRLSADPKALRRVITNLVSNALKFTPSGGSVTLTAEKPADGEWLRVAVRDTGIGIPREKLGSVFAKFMTIHETADLPRRVPPGTGLGLAICKEIVEGHGGRIMVESEAGRGSVFSFLLPAKAAA